MKRLIDKRLKGTKLTTILGSKRITMHANTLCFAFLLGSIRAYKPVYSINVYFLFLENV